MFLHQDVRSLTAKAYENEHGKYFKIIKLCIHFYDLR